MPATLKYRSTLFGSSAALWLGIVTATSAKVVYNALLPYDAFILIGFKAIGLNH